MDSEKQDGIQKLLRAEQEANAIVTAARQGGTVFETFRSFFSCSGAASHTRRAFRSFSFGFGFAEDKSFHSHPFLSLFVWRLQKKRRESNKPKTKRRLRSNCTETNESNATSKW